LPEHTEHTTSVAEIIVENGQSCSKDFSHKQKRTRFWIFERSYEADRIL
jgi:hypothetical protein